jgi:hypothetical protein
MYAAKVCNIIEKKALFANFLAKKAFLTGHTIASL